MSDPQNRQIARKFVEEIFNARKTDQAENFVTQDIVYHGMGEEVKSLPEFKKWVTEDLSAFPDMKVTILDDFGDASKIAIRWNLKGTHEKDFADFLKGIKAGKLRAEEKPANSIKVFTTIGKQSMDSLK